MEWAAAVARPHLLREMNKLHYSHLIYNYFDCKDHAVARPHFLRDMNTKLRYIILVLFITQFRFLRPCRTHINCKVLCSAYLYAVQSRSFSHLLV